MVTLHPIVKDQPARSHNLRAKEDLRKGFDKGEVRICYIQKMQDGRFGVMSASGVQSSFYQVFTEEQLHATFEEID